MIIYLNDIFIENFTQYITLYNILYKNLYRKKINFNLVN